MKPVDIIVLVLAVALGISLIATAVVPAILGEPVSENRAKLIHGAVIAMIAIVSVYVGARMREGRNNGDE